MRPDFFQLHIFRFVLFFFVYVLILSVRLFYLLNELDTWYLIVDSWHRKIIVGFTCKSRRNILLCVVIYVCRVSLPNVNIVWVCGVRYWCMRWWMCRAGAGELLHWSSRIFVKVVESVWLRKSFFSLGIVTVRYPLFLSDVFSHKKERDGSKRLQWFAERTKYWVKKCCC